ncbi:MAG: glycosyltransferase [Saprospiraceae bacterium]
MNSLYEPLLIEVAWEVCNKVGGIYTVIQSKVPYMKERWGDQYCLLGPMTSNTLPFEFQASEDYNSPFGKAVLSMREAGFKVEYGYWLIAGKPKVILFNVFQLFDQLPTIKSELLENDGVFIRPDDLAHQVVVFGELIYEYLKHITNAENNDKQVIVHFHEWMASSSMGKIKREEIPVATVFTTHATSLGRYLAMNDKQFYKKLSKVNWREAATHFGIEAQATIERMAAEVTDVMSTVSHVTDTECEFLLGRKADIILPNGLNINRFEDIHHLQNLHAKYRTKINDFIMGHFFNNYTFDLDNTLYFFTSGRYEYINKGYDVTLEALNLLNARMKRAKINKNVIMFFITKRPYTTINPLVLELRSLMEEIKETCTAIEHQIGEKLYLKAAQSDGNNTLPDLNKLVDEYWQFRYKKTLLSWKTPYLPIIVTHNLVDDQSDEILQSMREKKMYNQEENPVKIIYHPDFIDSTNPLFKLDYYQFVRGCHLGIFPSYYEPWGYTPVECLVRGVPTVTSDLAGFGDYAKSKIRNMEEDGIYLVNRRHQSFDEAAEQLADYMFDFVQKNRRERIALRNKVESNAKQFSWDTLGRYYIEAYRMAVEKYNKVLSS